MPVNWNRGCMELYLCGGMPRFDMVSSIGPAHPQMLHPLVRRSLFILTARKEISQCHLPHSNTRISVQRDELINHSSHRPELNSCILTSCISYFFLFVDSTTAVVLEGLRSVNSHIVSLYWAGVPLPLTADRCELSFYRGTIRSPDFQETHVWQHDNIHRNILKLTVNRNSE
jgi:hypothetical protein